MDVFTELHSIYAYVRMHIYMYAPNISVQIRWHWTAGIRDRDQSPCTRKNELDTGHSR